MEQENRLKIAIKFAEIDNKSFSEEQDGWVSGFVKVLKQTLAFYFEQQLSIQLMKETEAVEDLSLTSYDALVYILSPAFIFSSNMGAEIVAIEKACAFNTEYINSKIYKVMKGPVETGDLPGSLSIGSFYPFYQAGSSSAEGGYETLFDWDNSVFSRKKYWDSFTNLLFSLLKNLRHTSHERLLPPPEETVYLGHGDREQLWNRTGLYSELSARGVRVLPDHDQSVEVKHLSDPIKFYLKKSHLAIHFPEEFLPLEEKSLACLADPEWLKRYIWFNPEWEKDLEKKRQYDELKQHLKNLDHVEAISAGIEELKEIVFTGDRNGEASAEKSAAPAAAKLYLICSAHFEEGLKATLVQLLRQAGTELLQLDNQGGSEKRLTHYRYLKEADCCLICYGGESPEWVRANINEVRKSTGLHTENGRKIKPGLLLAQGDLPAEVASEAGSFTVISAHSPSLAEELNTYIYE